MPDHDAFAGSPAAGGSMPTTHWSVIAAARDPDSQVARGALNQLCESYWYPLYGHLRRKGHSPEDAQDLTQGFFAELIAKHRLDQVEQARGRFRSFLLAAIQNHASDAWDRYRAAKRGGRLQIVSLDEHLAEERFRHEPADAMTPEQAHDRRWALTVLHNARCRLEQEFRDANKAHLYDALKGFLPGQSSASQDEVAASLRVTKSAVRCGVQRLRRRFAELIRLEVAETLAVPTRRLVDEEVQHLLEVAGATV